MRTAARRACATLVAAAVVGGCGGGDDAPAKIESKGDFIAAGDKICMERDERSVKLAADAGNDADVARLTGALAGIYADTIGRLLALALPPGEARAGAQKYTRSVEQMRRPVERMKAASEQLATAVAGKNTAVVKRAAEDLQLNVNTVQAIGDLADQNARGYGFRVCGQQQDANPVS